jgi:hypothetical protein
MAAFQRLQNKIWALATDKRWEPPIAPPPANKPRKTRPERQSADPEISQPVAPSVAYQKFLNSMKIGFDEWHDGIGYDLDALKKIAESEREPMTRMLVRHLADPEGGWRDIEALAVLASPEAKRAIRSALSSTDPETRLYAAEALHELGEPVELDKVIAKVLRTGALSNGLTLALQLAEEHPTPLVRKTLLKCALDGEPETRVHAAALSLYLARKAKEAFDWDHRPFFLRFADEHRKERLIAYRELCERMGIK